MHLTDDELILHHYGERATTDPAGAAAHLETCRTCGAAYARLQRTLAAVDDSRPPEPSEGFERTVWARLQPALENRQRSWVAWWVFSPARLALVATLALLITGAFLAGRMSTRIPRAAPDLLARSQVRERVLLADLGDHLDRSQAMLVELVSGGAGAAGMAAERQRAEQLVSDNRLYRQTAAATGNATLVTVLDELERVLVDIAAGPDVASANDLEQVRREIDTNGLLFKVRVLSSEVRERQRAAMRLRTGQSS
jgi:hypothetical protein